MIDNLSLDSDIVELWIVNTGDRIKWVGGYSFHSEFLTPADGFTFTTGDPDAVATLLPKLPPGTQVQLVINGRIQATGYVDSATVSKTVDGGFELVIHGRDSLAPMVDAHVDPLFVFSAGMTLNDLLAKLATPFGFTIFSTTDVARKARVTGLAPPATSTVSTPGSTEQDYNKIYATGAPLQPVVATIPTTTLQYDPNAPVFLKPLTVQQAKPHDSETVFQFLSRHAKRFGLWLWADSLGTTLIVARPDFGQSSNYQLYNRLGGEGSNYERASLEANMKEQPSVIIAMNRGGQASYNKMRIRAAMVNELTAVDSTGAPLPAVQQILSLHKFTTPGSYVAVRSALIPYGAAWQNKIARPMFIYDDESKTVGQIQGAVMREMAERQSKALQYKVRVYGHTFNDRPWAVNTICDVDDHQLGVFGRWWIREVEFTKSRAGTFTNLTMIPPYTLQLF